MDSILKISPSKPEPHLIAKAGRILTNGGVIGYPTETVYGIGCNVFDEQAVERIYNLKGRDRSKAMILIAADIVQISELVESIPESAERLIDNFWPGPLTIVFEATSRLKEFAFRAKTVAVRIPGCAICLDLIKQIGFPLVSTSANLAGLPPSISAEQVLAAFGDQLDIIIDGGPTPDSLPSTLVDITRTPARIVREGAVSALEIKTVLEID